MPAKKRGRPKHRKTAARSEQVRVLSAHGMTKEHISQALEISIPTLNQYCGDDFEKARAKVKADVIMARYKAAMDGNVSAMNKTLEFLMVVPPKPVKQRVQPIGKKEQTLERAKEGHKDGGWGEVLNTEKQTIN